VQQVSDSSVTPGPLVLTVWWPSIPGRHPCARPDSSLFPGAQWRPVAKSAHGHLTVRQGRPSSLFSGIGPATAGRLIAQSTVSSHDVSNRMSVCDVPVSPDLALQGGKNRHAPMPLNLSARFWSAHGCGNHPNPDPDVGDRLTSCSFNRVGRDDTRTPCLPGGLQPEGWNLN